MNIPRILLLSFFIIGSIFFARDTHAQGWQWGIGNGGETVDGWPVATDASGNIFVAGVSSNLGYPIPITFGGFSLPCVGYGNQVVLAKYSPSGTVLWAISTGIANGPWLVNIATDPSGNVFLLCAFSEPSIKIGSFTLTNSTSPATQYMLAKVDPSGTVLWAVNDGNAQVFGHAVSPPAFICSTGGVAVDAAGNSYITANFNKAVTTVGTHSLTNHGGNDILVAKYDPLGNVVWATSFGGTKNDEAYGITVTPAGDIYLAGIFVSPSLTFGGTTITNASPANSENAFIARLNNSGVPTWACSSGGTGGEFAVGVSADALNNVYLVGGVSDASISFSGTTIANPYPGKSVCYVVKFDPSNNVGWSKTIGSASGDTWGFNAAFTPCGGVWVCGDMNSDVTVDGHTISEPAGSYDPVFIAGFTAAGTYAGGAALQSGADDQDMIACDKAGNVFLCADYQVVSPFVVGTTALPSAGSIGGDEILYLAKYTPTIIPDTNFTHKDTSFCVTSASVLFAPSGYPAYTWNNGKTYPTDTINAAGTYWVTAPGSCSMPTLSDTFHVTSIASDTQSHTTDTTVCSAAGITLHAPGGYTNYLWNNGSTSSSLSTPGLGTFWVLCTGNSSCIGLADTFHVIKSTIDLSFSLGPDTTVCAPLELTVHLSGVTYLWQDGSSGSTLWVSRTGLYYATVSEQGCSYTDSINVDMINLQQNLRDTTLCRDAPSQVVLQANVPAGATALWNTGSTASSITVSDTGTYRVTVTDAGCSASDTAVVTSELCFCHAILPNAFTPNNDKDDDDFYPIFPQGCSVNNYSFSIYNRWGQQVFSTTDQNAKWDGTLKGEPAELGVYMYYLQYQYGANSTRYFVKGDVTLVR